MIVDVKDDAIVARIARIVGFKGKSATLRVFVGPMSLNSYWSEGHKDVYTVINLTDFRTIDLGDNHPWYHANEREAERLPNGGAVVNHEFCRGGRALTIYVNAESLARLLPMAEPLTWAEKVVLCYTRSLKSSYGGVTNLRFVEAARECRITSERWEEAKTALKTRKLLNKAGALTTKGRNAAADLNQWTLRKEAADAI